MINTLNTDTAKDDGAQQPMNCGESEKSKRVSSAVQFLHDSRVKFTPAANKIKFLKTKGLTAEEICEAFEKAGQTTSLDEIKKAMHAPSFGRTRPAVVNSAPASGNGGSEAGYALRQNPMPTYAGPLYAPQPPPFPPMPQESKGIDWRDVVIGVGAALLGGIGAFKAFQTYSPYEIRRKDESANQGARGEVRRRGKRDEEHASSNREAGYPVSPFRSVAASPPATLPPLPATTPTAAANTPAETTEGDARDLQTELKETQEALEKEKKSKAELSLTCGKLRAQLNNSLRKNEKLELRVKTLQEELDKAQDVASSQKEPCETVTSVADNVPDPQQDIDVQPNDPLLSPPGVPTDTVDSAPPEPKEVPVTTVTEGVEGEVTL
ncbi:peroxin 14 [Trypanosoma rangeli]|uniref:Peroxisomal membrane protein PEX14 n=1 Tax=Trypanosoma rangeli TaxID=5698 RepID=A0A422N8R6_TRYRA|nr:peroxin 14 [Trypanosoma rangeli]RNF01878.1 peroxin 14 [Trypanosoma rangeli]|eukprot:RNF01878.1 peroxin 14 [Trypanosoma rangeli]